MYPVTGESLRLLFSTFKGITRVSKESIFSDLNNLEVVTTILGEIQQFFLALEKVNRDRKRAKNTVPIGKETQK